jgi:hypothetical protein
MLPTYFPKSTAAFSAQIPGKIDRHIAYRIFLGSLSQDLLDLTIKFLTYRFHDRNRGLAGL